MEAERSVKVALKIEHHYNQYKVSFLELSTCKYLYGDEDELTNTVAHYYVLSAHKPHSCPVCKNIKQEEGRAKHANKNNTKRR